MGRDDRQVPGFNAPSESTGPIVSKRTGRRRTRVQQAFGAPEKPSPAERLRRRKTPTESTESIAADDRPPRSLGGGIAITLLILVVLGTKGFGLLDGGSGSPEPSAPTAPSSVLGRPRLVERLPGGPASTIVARADATTDG